jgi:hypothetical protein
LNREFKRTRFERQSAEMIEEKTLSGLCVLSGESSFVVRFTRWWLRAFSSRSIMRATAVAVAPYAVE